MVIAVYLKLPTVIYEVIHYFCQLSCLILVVVRRGWMLLCCLRIKASKYHRTSPAISTSVLSTADTPCHACPHHLQYQVQINSLKVSHRNPISMLLNAPGIVDSPRLAPRLSARGEIKPKRPSACSTCSSRVQV
jgi:hypothetical protein